MTAPNRSATAKGMIAPAIVPAAMPIAAMQRISASVSAKTYEPDAPNAFIAAIVMRFRSTKPRTALAMPLPPTISDVNPIRVRNCVSRSMFLENCGETLVRVRTSQPALGKAVFAASMKRVTSASDATARPRSGLIVTRVIQRTSPPGCSNPLARSASCERITRGPKPIPAASLSGSLVRNARNSNVALPISTAIAELEIEFRAERFVGDHSGDAVANS